MTNIITAEQQKKEELPPKVALENLNKEMKERILAIASNVDASEAEEFKILARDLETRIEKTKIDNGIGQKIVDRLKKTFGINFAFSVKMKHTLTPFTKDGKKNVYRYMIDSIEWKNGPNAHEIYYFLVENFKYYLSTAEFTPHMFKRTIPEIEKRYMNWFNPIPIHTRTFEPIPISTMYVIERKENSEVKNAYYIIDAVYRNLGIQNIKGETLADALTNFQAAIEDLYYGSKYDIRDLPVGEKPKYDKRREALMKLVKEGSTPEPDFEGQQVDDSEEQSVEQEDSVENEAVIKKYY